MMSTIMRGEEGPGTFPAGFLSYCLINLQDAASCSVLKLRLLVPSAPRKSFVHGGRMLPCEGISL